MHRHGPVEPDLVGPVGSQTPEEEAAALARLRFFLHKPATPRDPSQGLPWRSSQRTPSSASSPGRTMVEFPTLYVLGPGAALPAGLGLASGERRIVASSGGGVGVRQR